MTGPLLTGRLSRRVRSWLLMAGAGVLSVVLFAGCGVPVDSSPSALPRKDVPFGLLQQSAPTTTTTSLPSPVELVPVSIYLIAPSGHLTEVTRQVPGAPEEPLFAALTALVQGPTNTEAQQDRLESAVPAQTTLLGVVTGPTGIITVNLGGTFKQLVGQANIQAVAQIVYTVSAQAGVTGVTFELSGQAVDVPTASGAQVPVANPTQYAPLAP